MEKISTIVIADAGPIIHLDELGGLDLLADFDKVMVPEAVWQEVTHHRPQALQNKNLHFIRQSVVHFSPHVNALSPLYTLHTGEQEALHLCLEFVGSLFITDDTAARLAAKNLGVMTHGTLGILIRAIRKKTRTKLQVIALLKAIPSQTTLHIRPSLLAEVINDVIKNS